MVTCSACNERVNNALLHSDSPKCQNGHDLGRWSSCGNESERHVYLSLGGAECPYCGSRAVDRVKEGSMVKCLFQTPEIPLCVTRPYMWMVEGPPCFMNHVAKMRLV